MKYTILPIETIYVDKFRLSSEYRLAESEFVLEDWVEEFSSYEGYRNIKNADWIYKKEYNKMLSMKNIVILASDFKDINVFDISEIRLDHTKHDPVYGDMDVYCNNRLPYLENIKPFLNWVKDSLENNEDYKIARNLSFDIGTIKDILQNWLINPNKAIVRHIQDGTAINCFANIENSILEQYLDSIINIKQGTSYTSESRYNFIIDERHGYTSELLSFIKYAIFESMVSEYFLHVRKDLYKYYEGGVKRAIEALNNYNYTKVKVLEKLVPSHGPASTKGGEFLRGLLKINYRLYNDGDNPVDYSACKSSFWSYVNCLNTIISSEANYKLFISCVPEHVPHYPNFRKNFKLYIENDFDGWLITSMMDFAILYVETEEGKSENTTGEKVNSWDGEEKIYNFINPIYEDLNRYSRYIPELQELEND